MSSDTRLVLHQPYESPLSKKLGLSVPPLNRRTAHLKTFFVSCAKDLRFISMKNPLPPGTRILRLKECLQLVGVSRSTWFDLTSSSSARRDETCPRRVRLGSRSVGWFEHELVAWLEAKRT